MHFVTIFFRDIPPAPTTNRHIDWLLFIGWFLFSSVTDFNQIFRCLSERMKEWIQAICKLSLFNGGDALVCKLNIQPKYFSLKYFSHISSITDSCLIHSREIFLGQYLGIIRRYGWSLVELACSPVKIKYIYTKQHIHIPVHVDMELSFCDMDMVCAQYDQMTPMPRNRLNRVS